MLNAIIFDVGGVLIRTHSWAGREKWAAKLGLAPQEFEKKRIETGLSDRSLKILSSTVSQAARPSWAR